MDWYLITEIVVGAAAGGLLIYDGVVIWKTKDKVSISQLVWDLSAKRPILPFAFGFLMGHFFFRG